MAKDSFWLITRTNRAFGRYQTVQSWRKYTITSNKVNNECNISTGSYTDQGSKQHSVYFRYEEIKEEVSIDHHDKRSHSPGYPLEKENTNIYHLPSRSCKQDHFNLGLNQRQKGVGRTLSSLSHLWTFNKEKTKYKEICWQEKQLINKT